MIKQAIENLKEKRNLFHSEDDFKLALALEINKLFPKMELRLEKPEEITMINYNDEEIIKRAPMDLLLIDENGNKTPIELKYKTIEANFIIDNDTYILKNHDARYLARHSFRKDIFRVEQFLRKYESNSGFVLILTNDEKYWTEDTSKKNNFDKHFSIHDGYSIQPTDNGWNYENIKTQTYSLHDDKRFRNNKGNKLHFTCKNDYFFKLNLNNSYKVNWEAYSQFENKTFKYLLLEIKRNI